MLKVIYKRRPWSEDRKKRLSEAKKAYYKVHPEVIEKMIKTKIGIHANEKHPGWKGDKVGYKALHIWMKRHLPKPEVCGDCKLPLKLELANISQKYLRDFSDWEWICHKCHMTKDGRLERFLKLPMTEERRHNIGLARIGKEPWNKGKKLPYTVWNKGKKYHFSDLRNGELVRD